MRLSNILVIKLRYVGDVLLATPVLSALKKAFPQADVSVAVNRGTEDILRDNPDVSEIIAVDKTPWMEQLRMLTRLRKRKFDCVIDLTDGDRSAFMTWATRAPIRIGFNDERRWRGTLYSSVVPKSPSLMHRTMRDMRALESLGIHSVPGPLTLRIDRTTAQRVHELLVGLGLISTGGDQRLLMFQPGARYWFKAWPIDRFAQLGDHLAQKWNCRIVIGGTAAERQTAEALKALMKAPVTVLAGNLSLQEYAAAVKHCALFVGNDNGAMHIATAVGTPVVGLFGPSDPKEWGPCGPRTTVLYKGVDCRACFHPTCERGELNCMRQISVDEVIEAALRLVAGEPSSDGEERHREKRTLWT